MVLPSSSGRDADATDHALEAAGQLFYERGIRAVGMDEIRDASGLSLKRLYALFPSKERVAEEVLCRRAEAYRASLAAYVAARPTPREQILAIFDYLAEGFAEPDYRGCPFINAYGEMNATSAPIAEAAKAQKRGLRALLGELVERAGGDGAIADQLALLVSGAMVSAAMLDARDSAEQAKAAALAVLERAGL